MKLTSNLRISLIAATACAAAALLPHTAAAAATENKLLIFNGTTTGGPPSGPLALDPAGNLYGVVNAQSGGPELYQLSPPAAGQTAWRQTILFSAATAGGSSVSPGDTVYYAAGSIYSLSGNNLLRFSPGKTQSDPWQETLLYSFSTNASGPDTAQPKPQLYISPKGVIYGVATAGGKYGAGTIFSVSPPAHGQTAWRETVHHSFARLADGSEPNGPLVADSAGVLYGTVTNGGGPFNGGYVYSFAPPAKAGAAWKKTFIWSIPSAYAQFQPLSGGVVLNAAGDILGVLVESFDKSGLVTGGAFELTKPAAGQTAWGVNIYRGQQNINGYFFAPQPAIDRAGNIYATTSGGGAFNDGTILRLTPPNATHDNWHEVKLLDLDQQTGELGGLNVLPNPPIISKSFVAYVAFPSGASSYGLGAVASLTQ
jgi:hypothetical protein